MSPLKGLYLHTEQHKHRIKAHNTGIHALSGIRIHDPSVRASEESSCLRPRGHCDSLCWFLRGSKIEEAGQNCIMSSFIISIATIESMDTRNTRNTSKGEDAITYVQANKTYIVLVQDQENSQRNTSAEETHMHKTTTVRQNIIKPLTYCSM
jgi:hypothetical protein